MDHSELYARLLSYANGTKEPERTKLYSYLRGLLAHYVLDRNCHPYVFYRTGFSDKPEDEGYYMYAHIMFEAYLDTLIAKQEGTLRNGRKAVSVSRKEVMVVSRMWHDVARACLGVTYLEPLSFYKAWKDMRFVEGLLYSRLGFKRAIYRTFMKKSRLYAMCSPRKVPEDEKIDFLNLKKAVWCDCVCGARRQESFPELVAVAQKEMEEVDRIIQRAKAGEDVLPLLRSFIHGIDHDGFLTGARKKHFSFAWDAVLPPGQRLI